MPQPGKNGPLNKADLDAAVKRINEQLEHSKANKARLEERAHEYDELKGALESLPEKIAHPIMVPFGPLAFFEGYIEHTNEVLTQLSSEWFAMRTTKSALEMVGRRQERLRRDQEDVAREERELYMRRQVAVGEGASASCSSSLDVPAPKDAPAGATVRYDEEGFFDIREPFFEDDDMTGSVPAASVCPPTPSEPKVLRPASTPARDTQVSPTMAEGHAAIGVGARRSSSTKAPVPPEGSDMFTRLKELERMEELEELEELDKLDELIGEGGHDAAQTVDAGAVQGHEGSKQQQNLSAPVVKSPADLFKMMSQVEQDSSSTAAAVASPEPSLAKSGMREGGFGGNILERIGSASTHVSAATVPSLGSASHASEHTLPASTADAGNAAPKRVSKFKAERQRTQG